ncbi:MAG: phosphotransferase family protein [Betaproteobacteria bacterium]
MSAVGGAQVGARGQGSAAARWGSAAFAARLAATTGASRATIARCEQLAGGAIQQNFRLDVDLVGGPWASQRQLVLRTGAASKVAASRPCNEEYALLAAAHAAGVATPQPIALHPGDAQWPAFMLMTFVAGEASGRRLTRNAGDHSRLVEAIGANLARLQAIRAPPPSLAFLGAPPARPTRTLVDGYRASIAQWQAKTGDARPVLAWTLRWLDARVPAREACVLVHRDYRVGNLMIDADRLLATLDWEFAGWGNPLEDLGWFCAPCWRFTRPDREAGGLAAIDHLLRGYNAVAGTAYQPQGLCFWQVLAQLRWAVIALQQALRFLDAGERSLELALTGRMLPELEWQMLALTGDTLG